jgi:hypothetical protein
MILIIIFTILEFKKLFNKDKTENMGSNNNSSDNERNDYIQAFQNLLSSSLDRIGVDNDCYISKNEKWHQENEDNHINLLNNLYYNVLFDRVLFDELVHYKKIYSNHSKSEFVQNYFSTFHHNKIAKHTPEFIQSRNNNLLSAYKDIIECINRIQGWMDNEKLRFKIESDYSNSPNHLSTIYQCTTPFSIVSLGCDQIGRYNIVYTLDYRIKEIIGGDFASTLIRRIYEFTPGEMESFVNFNSLQGDCINTFEEILQLTKIERNHIVSQKERFEGKSLSDELNKLILRDDLDDDARKWFNK